VNFKNKTVKEFLPAKKMIGEEDKCVFPLIDGTLFNVKEQDGFKSILI
jgi:hypothetical protein